MPYELYRRTSRLCSIEALDSRLRAAVLAAAEVEHLDEALETLIACVETHSVPRRRPGLLTHVMGRGLRHQTLSAGVLLPRHLLIAVTDLRSGTTTAHAVELADVTVTDADQYGVVDGGVTVLGRWSGMSETASLYVGLGADEAGGRFKELLHQAVARAKRQRPGAGYRPAP
ncbi:hypothetical protein GA0115233_101242 [Streptomyces sp. DI166]|uniref:hypothetical protein n=1 Tax=Streptomyces sp. DI166 TaxID=1839783 RepID=UPI0007F5272F|nr:hypothetical protein [Streptomyces sp. DI166]SBT89788.1 hypothetical protein GA0115233_101242 [Streptomyces sp. DI166]